MREKSGGMKKKIAVFVSGSGTNLQQFIDRYRPENPLVDISVVISNNPNSHALVRAKAARIPFYVFKRSEYGTHSEYSQAMLDILFEYNIDLIVLAGYMVKIPHQLITAYPQKIVNIHPALLPDFGGKGFYGNFVHEAVIRSGAQYSGITIHFVNEKYDAGQIILQKKIPLTADETPDSLAGRIHQLEYIWYPQVIEWLCNDKIEQDVNGVRMYD